MNELKGIFEFISFDSNYFLFNNFIKKVMFNKKKLLFHKTYEINKHYNVNNNNS